MVGARPDVLGRRGPVLVEQASRPPDEALTYPLVDAVPSVAELRALVVLARLRQLHSDLGHVYEPLAPVGPPRAARESEDHIANGGALSDAWLADRQGEEAVANVWRGAGVVGELVHPVRHCALSRVVRYLP